MDVRMPDGTIIQNVPEGITKAQLQGRLAKAQTAQKVRDSRSTFSLLTDRAASWIPFSDEAAGVGNAIANGIMAPFSSKVDFKPRAAYEEGKQGFRADAAEATKRAPVAATAADVLGLIGSVGRAPAKIIGGATSLGRRAVAGLKAGAIGGAIQGFAGADGIHDRVAGAGLGALLGAGVGGALPVAVSPLLATAQGVNRMLRPDSGLARQLVTQAFEGDGLAPRAAGVAMDAARGRGSPVMLADLGDNLRALAGSASRHPGPSRTLMRRAVVERQMGQGERIRGAITRDLGDIADPAATSEALIEQAKASSGPLYKKAYAQPIVSTPEIDAILQTPAGRGALAHAQTIAANEGVNPKGIGFALDAEGNAVLNSVPVDAHANYAAARAAHDAAINALKKAQTSQLTGGGATVSTAAARAQEAAADLDRAQQILQSAPSPEAAASIPGYTTKTLDYVKGGLDTLLEPYRNQITGKLELDRAGNAINSVKNRLLSEMDRLNPVYPQARAAFGGPMKEKDALNLGRKALTMSPEEVQRVASRLSDTERQQFGLGYRAALSESIDRRVDGADKVGALIGSPRKRQVLTAAMGGHGNLENFANTLADEQAGNQTYRVITGGSPTAKHMLDDAVTGDAGLMDTASEKVLAGAANGGLYGGLFALGRTVKDASRMGVGEAGKRVRQDLAALLSETDPVLLNEAMRKAAREEAARRLAKRRVGGMYRHTAGAAGRLAGGISAYGLETDN